MLQPKVKFFRDETRALEFNAKVQGVIYTREDWEFDMELEVIEFSEGLKEEFEYLVSYFEEEAE